MIPIFKNILKIYIKVLTLTGKKMSMAIFKQ